ncbi:TetR family transcriptional regulator C-terminal domain-containing protein [Microbispora sp. NEAU-D428]|uniref:TetR/AcrR family transcriptional regulator n=1 Tax=Microbispora sitophila TaxID=2771537 RepID=UPI001867F3DF|nr:TetR family transcriptional regulator C-terminal domain-containing protein [Microbispora sitophila]MBE3015832.1 TetR family transcriptional regulator C-terminal domain-containing protein [Microbispora sitophila]
MPRVVDPAERRREITGAVLRVVRRDGLENASVRNVAREAGLSMGSLRHYFATQSELMAFAFRSVIERIDDRVAGLAPEPDPRERVERTLLQLLPLDDERRAENEVWLAFTTRAAYDRALRPLRDEGYDALRAACHSMITDLSAAGLAPADVPDQAGRLHALLDGLAVHAAMRPDLHTAESLSAIIACHLDGLAVECRAARRPGGADESGGAEPGGGRGEPGR